MTLWQRFKNWKHRRAIAKIVKQSGGEPTNLGECFERLNNLLPTKEVEIFRAEKEKSAMAMAHFGLGMWIRNNWKLWRDGKIVKWFNDRGIYHADDMSGIILTSYHRHLNNQNIGLMDQIEYYRSYWKNKGIDPDTMKETLPWK